MSISIRYAVRLVLVSLLLPVSGSTAYSSDGVWFFCTTFNDKMEFNISRLFRVDTSEMSLKREEWVGTKREFEKYTKGDVGMCRAFESEEEALSKFMSTPNRVPYQEWKPSWMRGHKSSDPSTLGKSLGEIGAGAAVIARRSKSSSDTSSRDDAWEGFFSTKVASVMTGYITGHIRKWGKVGTTRQDFDPIAGIVQIALFQLGFFPGPVDGRFDQKTVSAITKWKTEKGQWHDSIFELVAKILREALVLEGHDPGPADEILGWLSVSHIQQSWESTYVKYTHGTGRSSGANELSRRSERVSSERVQTTAAEGWKALPGALHCVSFPRSKNGKFQFFRNNCNFKIVARWCYKNRRDGDEFGLCDPGPPGLDYVRSALQNHPIFYPIGEALGPHETNGQILSLGQIRFIACGKDHIEDATWYQMEWDVHTGMFRCLALFPGPGGPRDPSGTVQ